MPVQLLLVSTCLPECWASGVILHQPHVVVALLKDGRLGGMFSPVLETPLITHGFTAICESHPAHVCAVETALGCS